MTEEKALKIAELLGNDCDVMYDACQVCNEETKSFLVEVAYEVCDYMDLMAEDFDSIIVLLTNNRKLQEASLLTRKTIGKDLPLVDYCEIA